MECPYCGSFRQHLQHRDGGIVVKYSCRVCKKDFYDKNKIEAVIVSTDNISHNSDTIEAHVEAKIKDHSAGSPIATKKEQTKSNIIYKKINNESCSLNKTLTKTICANIVGISYSASGYDIDYICEHVSDVVLRREPDNKHDSNAVIVSIDGRKIGYINREEAKAVSRLIENGVNYSIGNKYKKFSKSVEISIKFELYEDINKIVPTIYAENEAGIYKISVLDDNCFYIGQAVNIKKRTSEHWKELLFGVHYNVELQKKWDTYGSLSFSVNIIEFAPEGLGHLETQMWLGDREQYWIGRFVGDSRCLNKKEGEVVHTKKSKEQMNDRKEKARIEHNNYVKERKEEIKCRIKDLEKEQQAKGCTCRELRYNAENLESFIRKHTGILSVFSAVSRESITIKKQILSDSNIKIAKIEQVLKSIYDEIKKLKDERRRLTASVKK